MVVFSFKVNLLSRFASWSEPNWFSIWQQLSWCVGITALCQEWKKANERWVHVEVTWAFFHSFWLDFSQVVLCRGLENATVLKPQQGFLSYVIKMYLPIHLVGTDVSLKDNFASISCEWVISFFNTSWNFLMSCHLLLHSGLCATFRMDTLALLPQLCCTAHILCVKAICCPTQRD